MLTKLFFFTIIISSFVPYAFPQTLSYTQALKKARAAEERYHYAEALQWYQQAWKIDSSNISVLVAISKQYTGLERLDDARDTFLHILTLEPNHTEAHTLLGIYYEKFADQFQSAKQHYQSAIEADGNYIRPRKLLCQLLIQLLEFGEAKHQAQALIQTAPRVHDGYTFLGSIELKEGNVTESVEALNKAVSLTNDDSEPYRLLAQALARDGKRDEAQNALQQYKQIKDAKESLSGFITKVRREPNHANHWFQLGKEYLKRKHMQNAVDSFQKGLELAPDSGVIHSILGALYLQNKKLPQAQQHLEAAVSLAPNDADIYNNLGVCYLMQQQFESAVMSFQTAVDLGKNEPGVYRNLQIAKQKLLQSK